MVEKQLSLSLRYLPGAGAAGGLGFALWLWERRLCPVPR
ncbi:hypothetical protein [Paenibacillus cremeus]